MGYRRHQRGQKFYSLRAWTDGYADAKDGRPPERKACYQHGKVARAYMDGYHEGHRALDGAGWAEQEIAELTGAHTQ